MLGCGRDYGGALTIHWDGSSWTIVPSASSGTLNGVAAVASNDVWAVGSIVVGSDQTLIEHWNGSQWQVCA